MFKKETYRYKVSSDSLLVSHAAHNRLNNVFAAVNAITADMTERASELVKAILAR